MAVTGLEVGAEAPAIVAEEVTPSDSADLSIEARGLYIGGAGNVACVLRGVAGTITFVGLLAGVVYPIMAQRVRATDTTATNIVALG